MPISPDLVEGNSCCWCQAGHGEVFSQVPSATAFHLKTEKSDMAYGSVRQTKKGLCERGRAGLTPSLWSRQ